MLRCDINASVSGGLIAGALWIILTDVALPKTTLMSARVGIPSILIACANVRLQFSWACVPDQLSTNWEAVDPFLKVCWSGVSVSGFFLD